MSKIRNAGRTRSKVIAPRLADGSKRAGIGHGLPEGVKEGLRAIARSENKVDVVGA